MTPESAQQQLHALANRFIQCDVNASNATSVSAAARGSK
jgi:hypothetical protein